MWRERGSVVFTDIFVRILSERHTNLWLLPPPITQIKQLEAWSLDGWRPTLLFILHFFTLFITGLSIYVQVGNLL